MSCKISVFRSLTLLSLVICSSAAQAIDLKWVGCGITRNAFMADLSAAYMAKYDHNITIEGGGATKGIRSVAAKQADIGGACRYKLNTAREESATRMVPVAWDALVAIVHNDNPVDSISLANLRDLYLGKITNWSQLGGESAPLELLIRRGKISGVGRSCVTTCSTIWISNSTASIYISPPGHWKRRWRRISMPSR